MAAEEPGSNVPCNHSEAYKVNTYTVVYSLVFILGLLSNAGALYVFCKLSVKNRLSTIILINLAVSDLVFILTLPLRIAYYQRETQAWSGSSSGSGGGSAGSVVLGHHAREADLLDLACRATTYLFYISMYCSIYFLTALSVCRYLVLSGRLRFQNQIYCRRVRFLCVGIWVLVLGGTVIYVAALDGFNIKVSGCFEPRDEDAWAFLKRANMLVLIVGFALPLLTVLLCYALMIRHILRAHSSRRTRDVALICLVMLVFLVCFLPYHVQRTLHLEHVERRDVPCEVKAALQRSVVATMCFAVVNSCLDPLIFLFVGNGFMRVLCEMARAWGFHGWRGGWRKEESSSSSRCNVEIRGQTCKMPATTTSVNTQESSTTTTNSPSNQQPLLLTQLPQETEQMTDGNGGSTAL
ncbi:cysteinyl leukotriene receptor 1-like [Engraulis encrasicolus]|uniref:cysteinyl leukotriene receptor 1-like n=1 Tax=Engraulis encrasicolus TaxID=184585 RepID=UPI002FD1B874